MRFVAVDVETANSDLASVCQIGVVAFESGSVTEVWDTLVDPEDYFDGRNTAIHGISEESVKGAPTFPQVFDRLRSILLGQIVAHHTPFDRVSLTRVSNKYKLESVDFEWLDTARVVRRVWPQFASSGYGLSNIAKTFDIKFKHHDAKEDARVCGELFVRAIGESGLAIADWLIRARQPRSNVVRTRQGNPDGPLAGEVVVFTGAMSMPRQKAADIAAEAGCDVATSVSKQTTLLVVGDQDIQRLVGHEKSSKHRKAEELIANGQTIRILGESDFLQIVEY